jgi:Mycobacterium 19 kDa lipoprotein antigen
MVDQTYTLTGTAAGFNTENPYARTVNDFTVRVAC